MGCFLACYGFSKKKRRRKPANKVAAGDHRRGSYVPLDSSLTIIGVESVDGAKESPSSAGSKLRDKPKELTRFKTRKKVSFNLNVQTYEPISTDYHFLESGEDEEMEKNGQEMSKGGLSTSASKRDSTTLGMGLFPSNYRYQNVRDSYVQEEHKEYEESDSDDNDDDDDDDDYDDDSDVDDQRISQEGFSKQLCSPSTNGELEYPNARDNIQKVYSVLSPVENLTQWKTAKAKAAAPMQQRKENQQPRTPPPYSRSSYNQSKPLLQEIPVHASLSSWLHSQSTNESHSFCDRDHFMHQINTLE